MGTTVCPSSWAAFASDLLSLAAPGASVCSVLSVIGIGASSSIGDMTSASDRPRLLLLMGDLQNPGPDFKKLGVGFPRHWTAHFAHTATFQRSVEINGSISYVGWTNRDWVARQRGTSIP